LANGGTTPSIAALQENFWEFYPFFYGKIIPKSESVKGRSKIFGKNLPIFIDLVAQNRYFQKAMGESPGGYLAGRVVTALTVCMDMTGRHHRREASMGALSSWNHHSLQQLSIA
jgi:hypothetical protein